MSVTFTKLFSSITESTVWAEPDHTRIVWIAMLAMADHAGRVWASIPGLANRARVSIDKCEEALNTFLSPDKYSRTKDFDGVRIEAIDGGWRLLNHAKYKAIRDHESIKESKRKSIAKRRAEEKAAKEMSTVDRGRHNAESDTEADREKKDQKKEPGVSRQQAGTRLAEDWVLPEDWKAWAAAERPDVDIAQQAASFADYWHGVPGQKGRKADWLGTWRNWIRRANASRKPQQNGAYQPMPGEI